MTQHGSASSISLHKILLMGLLYFFSYSLLSFHGHLCCLYFLTSSYIDMNILSIMWHTCLAMRLAESYGNPMFNIQRSCQTASQSA